MIALFINKNVAFQMFKLMIRPVAKVTFFDKFNCLGFFFSYFSSNLFWVSKIERVCDILISNKNRTNERINKKYFSTKVQLLVCLQSILMLCLKKLYLMYLLAAHPSSKTKISNYMFGPTLEIKTYFFLSSIKPSISCINKTENGNKKCHTSVQNSNRSVIIAVRMRLKTQLSITHFSGRVLHLHNIG